MQGLAKAKNPRWEEEQWVALSNRTPLLRKAAAAMFGRVEDELPPELAEPQAWALLWLGDRFFARYTPSEFSGLSRQ